MILAGDIGGTKTTLALFAMESGPHVAGHEATFPSSNYPDFQSLLESYLRTITSDIEAACFGVAGPVVGGRASITNLGWAMDEKHLGAMLHAPVLLLNDLEAVATSVPHLQPSHLCCLNTGMPQPGGAIGVIAPGTGLGEAFLTWDGTRYRAHSTEGGHCDFAPTDQRQTGLLKFLQDQFGHVSYERVCSGIGIPNIYAYLRQNTDLTEPQWLARKLSETSDATPVIVSAAMDRDNPCPLCQAALDLFLSALGAEAGNLALKVMATGGIYVGGGIPPRIIDALKNGPFLTAFTDKGRHANLMKRIPVHIIGNPKTALAGAALAAFAYTSTSSSKETHRV